MSRGRAKKPFTRVSHPGASLVISSINLKQWSRRDRIPGTVVIHITVYYRSLSDTLSTGPFDLFLGRAFGVGGLDSFPVWAQLELSFGFQIISKNNNIN